MTRGIPVLSLKTCQYPLSWHAVFKFFYLLLLFRDFRLPSLQFETLPPSLLPLFLGSAIMCHSYKLYLSIFVVPRCRGYRWRRGASVLNGTTLLTFLCLHRGIWLLSESAMLSVEGLLIQTTQHLAGFACPLEAWSIGGEYQTVLMAHSRQVCYVFYHNFSRWANVLSQSLSACQWFSCVRK